MASRSKRARSRKLAAVVDYDPSGSVLPEGTGTVPEGGEEDKEGKAYVDDGRDPLAQPLMEAGEAPAVAEVVPQEEAVEPGDGMGGDPEVLYVNRMRGKRRGPNLPATVSKVFMYEEDKKYKCSMCPYQTNEAGTLKSHTRTHTGEKPFKCDHCDAAFAQAGTLKVHVRTHTGEKPYVCDQCEAAFAQATSLVYHKSKHSGEKAHKCETCGAAFALSGSLKAHIRSHTGERPYKCDQCDAAFAHASDRMKHLRTHSGEKPHKCDTCSAAFVHANDLTKHSRIHTGDKPYKCDQCEAAFARGDRLKKHQVSIHGAIPLGYKALKADGDVSENLSTFCLVATSAPDAAVDPALTGAPVYADPEAKMHVAV